MTARGGFFCSLVPGPGPGGAAGAPAPHRLGLSGSPPGGPQTRGCVIGAVEAKRVGIIKRRHLRCVRKNAYKSSENFFFWIVLWTTMYFINFTHSRKPY